MVVVLVGEQQQLDVLDAPAESRKALLERCENEVGPYQSPKEDGMMHFHEYLRGKLAGRIEG